MKKLFAKILSLTLAVVMSMFLFNGCGLVTKNEERDMAQIIATVSLDPDLKTDIKKKELKAQFNSQGAYYVNYMGYTEQETYEKTRKIMPTVGSIVETPYGTGEVMSNSLVKETVIAKFMREEGDGEVIEVPITKLKLVSGSYEGSVDEKDIRIEVEDETDAKALKELFKGD